MKDRHIRMELQTPAFDENSEEELRNWADKVEFRVRDRFRYSAIRMP
jgi:hypothetical protein